MVKSKVEKNAKNVKTGGNQLFIDRTFESRCFWFKSECIDKK